MSIDHPTEAAPPSPAPWSAPAPRPAGRRGGGGRVVAIVGLVVVLVVAGVSVVVAGSDSWFPDRWDPQVAAIARDVEDIRGLEFDHPVPIHFLPADEFEERLGVGDDLDDESLEEFDDSAAVLRALGLLAGDADLQDAVDTSATSGTLAYYDPDEEEIVVRGEDLDVAHRVTVAHELTHALQDQHFDLAALEEQVDESSTGDSSAFSALVEGDATRVEDEYLASLSADSQDTYDHLMGLEGDRFEEETADVPEVVELIMSAPYVFGPSTIRVLVAEGGNEAVDDAFRGPPLSQRMFVQPGVLEAVEVPQPDLPEGATDPGDPTTLGSFDAYLLLAPHMDPKAALEIADMIAGGASLDYDDESGRRCVIGAFAVDADAERGDVVDALEVWATALPDAEVHAGEYPTIVACDPGEDAAGPGEGALSDAAMLLSLRNELTAQTVEVGVDADDARCISARFMDNDELVAMLLDADPDAALTEEQGELLSDAGADAAIACGAAPDLG
jgi:hypothetical protein